MVLVMRFIRTRLYNTTNYFFFYLEIVFYYPYILVLGFEKLFRPER